MDRFLITDKINASVYTGLDGDILSKLWRGFTFTVSGLSVTKDRNLPEIVIGDVTVPSLPSGAEYAYRVSALGVGIIAKNDFFVKRFYC